MKTKIITITAAILLLSGCATNKNLYEWGNYEETLFVYFHEPEVKDQMLTNYLAFIEKAQAGSAKKVAPGLFAEAGTFMLEKNDVESALRFYQLEHKTWPESRSMMEIMISNLEARRAQAAAQ